MIRLPLLREVLGACVGAMGFCDKVVVATQVAGAEFRAEVPVLLHVLELRRLELRLGLLLSGYVGQRLAECVGARGGTVTTERDEGWGTRRG